MRQRSDRLGRHILERNRAKPLLLGDRAGTGLRDRQIRPAGRGGRLRVAQHQPDGIRLLPGRTRGLRKAFGRLSLTGALRFQRSHNSVRHPQDQRKGARRVGLGGRTRPLAYEPGFVQHVRGGGASPQWTSRGQTLPHTAVFPVGTCPRKRPSRTTSTS